MSSATRSGSDVTAPADYAILLIVCVVASFIAYAIGIVVAVIWLTGTGALDEPPPRLRDPSEADPAI